MGKNIVIPPFYKKLFWRDIIGSLTLGTLIGGVWMWQINKTRAKRADYYKQLALANKQQQ